jgi:hypothetical protein
LCRRFCTYSPRLQGDIELFDAVATIAVHAPTGPPSARRQSWADANVRSISPWASWRKAMRARSTVDDSGPCNWLRISGTQPRASHQQVLVARHRRERSIHRGESGTGSRLNLPETQRPSLLGWSKDVPD